MGPMFPDHIPWPFSSLRWFSDAVLVCEMWWGSQACYRPGTGSHPQVPASSPSSVTTLHTLQRQSHSESSLCPCTIIVTSETSCVTSLGFKGFCSIGYLVWFRLGIRLRRWRDRDWWEECLWGVSSECSIFCLSPWKRTASLTRMTVNLRDRLLCTPLQLLTLGKLIWGQLLQTLLPGTDGLAGPFSLWIVHDKDLSLWLLE